MLRFFPRLDLQLRSFVLIISWKLTISFNLLQIKSLIRFCKNIPSVCFDLSFTLDTEFYWSIFSRIRTLFTQECLLEESRDFEAPICFSDSFCKAFPRWEYANLDCSITCLQLEGSIYSPVKYSYLCNVDIFDVPLLISYCSSHL